MDKVDMFLIGFLPATVIAVVLHLWLHPELPPLPDHVQQHCVECHAKELP